MAGLGRNERCPCGSGRKVKRCCGVQRGPSEDELAKAMRMPDMKVRLLTTNHLIPQEIADTGPFPLAGQGWGYGMAVSVTPDEISAPGRYAWDGGYGTTWFNDPRTGVIGIGLTQVTDFLFGGALTEFERLANGR